MITTIEMEIALAQHFNFLRNIIVPNVKWGMVFITKGGYDPLHECDLLVCTKSGYLWECEIKISKADLVKDKKKRHNHIHPAIRLFYFAIPEKLKNCIEHIPERAGIIVVKKDPITFDVWCEEIRKPKQEKGIQLSEEKKLKLALLGCMRIWTLKKRLVKK